MIIKQNPDKEHVKKIREKLKQNDNYCPCVITRTPESQCMCEEFRNQKTDGYCHCELYYKKIEKGDFI